MSTPYMCHIPEISNANDTPRMIVVSIYCLAIAHPGPIFDGQESAIAKRNRTVEPQMEDGMMPKSG